VLGAGQTLKGTQACWPWHTRMKVLNKTVRATRTKSRPNRRSVVRPFPLSILCLYGQQEQTGLLGCWGQTQLGDWGTLFCAWLHSLFSFLFRC
jgi:hypothetical protein